MIGTGAAATIEPPRDSDVTTQKTKPIDRKRISEALLADRLGLNEFWIERWQQNGKWREESGAPDQLPDFIRKNRKKPEIEDIESEIERLVTAGCRRQVVYFCLAQLSPEAAWFRAGGESVPVFGTGHVAVADTDYFVKCDRKLATREELEAVANNAKAARKQIHRYQREIVLIAESTVSPLPVGLMCRPESPVDALTLLQDSLTWAATLAAAYTAPFESTLLKSKGVLYLTLYVSLFANIKKLRGSKLSSLLRDSSRPSGTERSRRTFDADNPLITLANVFRHKNKAWSTSELYRKLDGFREDHPRLYKRLAQKLTELHDFASR
jgi:hypothetical protein